MALVSVEHKNGPEPELTLQRRDFVSSVASRWKVYALCPLCGPSSSLLRVTGMSPIINTVSNVP